MSTGPVEFLRVALAEAKDRASRNGPDSWHSKECGYEQVEFSVDCRCVAPAMVLRAVAATGKLLVLHFPTYDKSACTLCGWGEGSGSPETGYWPCETLKIEAERWGWTGE